MDHTRHGGLLRAVPAMWSVGVRACPARREAGWSPGCVDRNVYHVWGGNLRRDLPSSEQRRVFEEAIRRRREALQRRWAAETSRDEIERKARRRRGRKALKRQKKALAAARDKQRETEKKQRELIESLLHRDAVANEINYMSGREFEKFMAALFRTKGYEVEETYATGDQGIDLLLPECDGKRVAIQLKRWTGPVGNAVIAATFAGMAHYRAEEGWIITTSTFTKSARELARSTSVRLIDGKELADWLEGLREE